MTDRPTIAGPMSDAAKITALKVRASLLEDHCRALAEALSAQEARVEALSQVLTERIRTLTEDLVSTIQRVQELEARCARLEALLLTTLNALDVHLIWAHDAHNADVNGAVEELREAVKEK